MVWATLGFARVVKVPDRPRRRSRLKLFGRVAFLTYRVEMTGLEPVTPCLQSRCSSQLSYIPRRNLVHCHSTRSLGLSSWRRLSRAAIN